jgi:hypothetical protein
VHSKGSPPHSAARAVAREGAGAHGFGAHEVETPRSPAVSTHSSPGLHVTPPQSGGGGHVVISANQLPVSVHVAVIMPCPVSQRS